MLSQQLSALRTRAETLRANLASCGKSPPPLPETHGTFAQKNEALKSYLRQLESLRGSVIAPVLSPAPGTFKPDAFPTNLRAPLERQPLAVQNPPPVRGSLDAAKPKDAEATKASAAARRNVELLDAYDALVTDAGRRAFARVHGNELRQCAMHNSLVTYIITARELTGRCRVLVSQERAKLDATQFDTRS